ncbi:uncharacterized protein LOC119352352 [Triticum dicoccoides]|uniref:uncharacterized protein LOC119352352 n=1 Tax=Triticum dicoccoides TaxID=85692 RepID=UPI001890B523|nr:uncharacterized protein LOC119352352 [Triticum dicoccoides]
MTVQVSFLCDQIGDLVLELLKMVPDEEPGNQLLSSVTRLNRLQWITDSINNFVSEIQVRVSREQMIERTRKEKEEQKRFLQQGQEVRTSEKKQEQERTLEEREINGQVMVAGGRLVTMATDRGLEGEAVISEAAAAAAEYEEEAFARFRRAWECRQGANSFEDLTLLSPMLFTHCTPGFKPVDAVLPRTMQICSIKVTDLKYFKWPLQVYGVVAARDAVDGRRNPIFLCPRDDCQILNEVDPFLHLTGPIRAIVSEEPVDIEIQLIIKGKTASEDRALVRDAFLYDGDVGHSRDGFRTSIIEKTFCTPELCSQQLKRSVQATIFGVHVVDEKLTPFQYGVRVVLLHIF